jgi:hypothetical protein
MNELIFIREVGKMYSEKKRCFEKMGEYECFCGNVFITRMRHVKTGNTKSCGCYRLSQLKKTICIKYKVGDYINGCKYLGETATKNKARKALFECKYCGNEFTTSISSIKSSHAKSCGCYKIKRLIETQTKHGLCDTKEYNSWAGMKCRCYDEKNERFSDYGGRGICVSQEWRDDFLQFFKDMGEAPSAKHSIDRIDVNGDYCKENCKWATAKEQNRNTTKTVYVMYKGERRKLIELIELSGVNDKTVRDRIKRGISVEDALENKVNSN